MTFSDQQSLIRNDKMDREQIKTLIKSHLEEGVDETSTDAYLDIETTGLSPDYSQITIVGIYIIERYKERLVQIVGDDITAISIIRSLEGVSIIFTYNGTHFDLPFINARHKVDLSRDFKHHDLMYRCWHNNLYGGLKCVEQQLNIDRNLMINGDEAVSLWGRYINDFDEVALTKLLKYNKEDVLNLKTLRERLIVLEDSQEGPGLDTSSFAI